MFPLERVLHVAIGSAIVFAFWKAFQLVYREFTSPLHHLRGPRSASLLYGNIAEITNCDRPEVLEDWVQEYGSAMKCQEFFGRPILFTIDTRAIGHILTHSDDYQKQRIARYILRQIFGGGLVVAESAQHRKQRRIMNPAFGVGQIRALTDIFFTKAIKLCDLWSSEVTKRSATTTTAGGTLIDVVPWLSWTTLDIIGLAGFNYEFDALNADGKQNQFNEAFSTFFSKSRILSVLFLLQTWIPPLRLIPTEDTRKVRVAQRTMTQIGRQLITAAGKAAGATEKGKIEKNSLQGRDLLSLLVKANMATDIPESQRLSDKDVLAQIPTFLIVGHESTSTAVTWAFYAMAQAPEVQTKLREELLSVDTDTPSMDELMALPYLDFFLRETLRLYPPVPITSRIAMKDDVVPVEKPFTDKHGVVHDTIKVKKGDAVLIHILAMNRSKELWGHDAHEFKPERWTEIPEAVSRVPGVWGHLLTFFGGPRGCIGYRFSLVEAKAILFTLVRKFEFELAVPASEVGSKYFIALLPVLRGDPENKGQLPLLIRPYEKE